MSIFTKLAGLVLPPPLSWIVSGFGWIKAGIGAAARWAMASRDHELIGIIGLAMLAMGSCWWGWHLDHARLAKARADLATVATSYDHARQALVDSQAAVDALKRNGDASQAAAVAGMVQQAHADAPLAREADVIRNAPPTPLVPGCTTPPPVMAAKGDL